MNMTVNVMKYKAAILIASIIGMLEGACIFGIVLGIRTHQYDAIIFCGIIGAFLTLLPYQLSKWSGQ